RQVRRENSLEAALLVLGVQHYHGRHAQRLLAVAARRRLTLQILHETVREGICRPGTPACLGPLCAAMRACVLDAVLERVAVKRGAAGNTTAKCLYRVSIHDSYLKWPKLGDNTGLDARDTKFDALLLPIFVKH